MSNNESTALLLPLNQEPAAALGSSFPNLPQNQNTASLSAGLQDFASSNKALTLFITHVIIYYSLAVIAFSFVVEKFSVIDSLYFATVLFTTIGYGDLVPASDAGRICTILLALYGITVLGIFLGIYGEEMMDARKEQSDQIRGKLALVVQEIRRSSGEDDVPEQDQEREEANEDRELTLLQEAWQVIGYILPLLSLVLVIALILGHIEGWDIIQSVYWCVISGTTVGLGEYSPHNDGVRLAAVFFLPIAVAVTGQFLGRVASAYMDREKRRMEKEYLSRTLTLCDLQRMDTDQNGKVDRAEFLSYMLVAIQRVSKEDVEQITGLFHKLDRTKEGVLTKDDLTAFHLDEKLRSSVQRAVSMHADS